MAKQRYINTKFWNDNFIMELSPIERYLFLYFLTNEHTNICGIYELPIRTIVFETGMKTQLVKNAMKKFEESQKIYYIDGWVYIKNFQKHQAVNEKTKKGIENKLQEANPKILEKIQQILIGDTTHIDGVSMGDTAPIDGVCMPHRGDTNYRNPNPNVDLNPNSNSNPIPDERAIPPFESFWEEYPKKTSKEKARKLWDQKNLDTIFQKILIFVAIAKETDRWRNPRFIPDPPNFLEGKRWEDDIGSYADIKPPDKKLGLIC